MMIKFRVIIIRGQPTHFAKLENNVEEISQVVRVWRDTNCLRDKFYQSDYIVEIELHFQ